VLAHFDVNAPTIVTCDASVLDRLKYIKVRSVRSRNVVTQRQNVKLSPACEPLSTGIFTCTAAASDHQALKTLLTAGGTGHRPLRQHRWADRLFQYTFSVVYRPGKQNVVADCLSRAFESSVRPPVVPFGQPSNDVEDDDDIAIQTIFGNLATSADPDLQRVLQHVLHGWPSSKPEVASELRTYFNVHAELSVAGVGRCLLRGSRVIIPTSLRRQLLELAHEVHPGISRMKSKCRAAI